MAGPVGVVAEWDPRAGNLDLPSIEVADVDQEYLPIPMVPYLRAHEAVQCRWLAAAGAHWYSTAPEVLT